MVRVVSAPYLRDRRSSVTGSAARQTERRMRQETRLLSWPTVIFNGKREEEGWRQELERDRSGCIDPEVASFKLRPVNVNCVVSVS